MQLAHKTASFTLVFHVPASDFRSQKILSAINFSTYLPLHWRRVSLL